MSHFTLWLKILKIEEMKTLISVQVIFMKGTLSKNPIWTFKYSPAYSLITQLQEEILVSEL